MRDVIGLLEEYGDHAEAKTHPVELDEVIRPISLEEVIDSRPVPPLTPLGSRPRWVTALAAAVVGLALIGGIGLLIQRSVEEEPPVITQAPTPTETTAPAEPSTTLPVPETTLPVVPDLPSATVTPLPLGGGLIELIGGDVGPASAALDPEGRLVVAYSDDDEHKLLRCVDSDCTEPLPIITLGPVACIMIEGSCEPEGIQDMALRPDGSPILIVGHPARPSPTIYACADPACSTIQTSPLGEDADWPQVVIGRDGLPRILHGTKLAVCGDPLCKPDQRSTVTIDDDLDWPSVHIDPSGQILISYTSDPAKVAVCTDDSCSAPPTILSFGEAMVPRTTTADDGKFLTWYRSGSEFLGEGDMPSESSMLEAWDLMVAECDSAGCDEGKRIEVGPNLLWSWDKGPWDATPIRTSDSSVAIGFAYWSSDYCGSMLKFTVVDVERGTTGTELGPYAVGDSVFHLLTRDDALLVVFSGEAGGIHLAELPITESGPIDAGWPPSDECPDS